MLHIEQYTFFEKALLAIENGLKWLEEHHLQFSMSQITYREIHLVCLWQHIKYYDVLPLRYLNRERIVDTYSKDSILQKTAPNVLKPKV